MQSLTRLVQILFQIFSWLPSRTRQNQKPKPHVDCAVSLSSDDNQDISLALLSIFLSSQSILWSTFVTQPWHCWKLKGSHQCTREHILSDLIATGVSYSPPPDIRITKTGLKSKVSHTISQVIPKVPAWSLTTIKKSHYYGPLPLMFMPKLKSSMI